MAKIENVYEVAKRLLGDIDPEGDSAIDETRYENLEQTIDVTNQLIHDIILVARHKGSDEFSKDKAGQRADEFISGLREILGEDINSQE